MLELLSDGLPHTREELHACLWDENANLSTVKVHISIIRRTLRPLGEDIVCVLFGYPLRVHYRQVKMLDVESAKERLRLAQ